MTVLVDGLAPDSPRRPAWFPYLGMTVTTDRLLDIAGLAERLGVGERFVRRLVNERRIPFVKVGRHVRFDAGDVEAQVHCSLTQGVTPRCTRRNSLALDIGWCR